MLYCKGRVDVSRTVEAALRESLTALGVDLSVPHDLEYGGTFDGKDLTVAEAKKLGLIDVKGRPMPGLGEDEAEGQAVL